MKSQSECHDLKSTEPLSALHLLHRAGQFADELFAGHVGGNDLTPRQYEVLKAVFESNEPSQTALVGLTGIDRSTLADIVRRLVERGFLARERTKHDARKYAVRLTNEGNAILEKAGPAVMKTDNHLLAALPDECRLEFLGALARIITANETRDEKATDGSS